MTRGSVGQGVLLALREGEVQREVAQAGAQPGHSRRQAQRARDAPIQCQACYRAGVRQSAQGGGAARVGMGRGGERVRGFGKGG